MRAVLLFESALFALPLLSTFHVSWPATVLVVLLLGVSARRPEDGLLVVSGLLPLATPLGLLLTPETSGRQTSELLLLPVLVAALARHGVRGTPGATPFGLAAAAAVSAIVGTAIAGLARDHIWTPIFDARQWLALWDHLTSGYLTDPAAYPAVGEAMVWLEAIGLAHVTYLTLRPSPAARARVCRMMAIGVAAAALLTANRLAEVFLRNQQSLRATAEVLGGVRIGIHAGDFNALGSLYALFVVPAFWSAVNDRRVWRWAAFVSIALALWWTGSRAAVAAGGCGIVAVALHARVFGWRTLAVAASLAAAVVALSVLSAVRPLSLSDALRIRVEMASVGLRMLQENPAFGVGLGQFRRASRPLLSDDMVSVVYRQSGENAHNNFVQLLAELGLVGGGAIAALVAVPLLMAWRGLAQPGPPPELAGLTGGVVAFLLTCVLGHPLLTPLCLWLFFLVLGAIAGLAWQVDREAPRRAVDLTFLYVLAIVCTIPFRVG